MRKNRSLGKVEEDRGGRETRSRKGEREREKIEPAGFHWRVIPLLRSVSVELFARGEGGGGGGESRLKIVTRENVFHARAKVVEGPASNWN